ncbi:MAG TPA: TylF/MycF/NovP-related O-methyltransferase [Cytophagaceae bacterium]|jgi:O-methyltransferase|nr:TylF/MycF/NovP-related O-methyltransferase [Cytophagaceae bacterium]
MDNIFLTKLFDWCEKRNIQNEPGFTNFSSTGRMTNIEQRINLFHLAEQVIVYGVEGDFVELGCHEGTTAALLQIVIEGNNSSKDLYLFDSFEGLPKPLKEDENTPFKEGMLLASEEKLRENFNNAGLTTPKIFKGWFDDTLKDNLPEKIAFAHLDGDLYESILISLHEVYPLLTKNAICVIDDYNDLNKTPNGFKDLPGVKAACDLFFKDKPEKIYSLYCDNYAHAYFRKV